MTFNQKYKINNLPLISIITVVFNDKEFLEETINSVINQTYPNIEYIIIDGASTDGTLEILQRMANRKLMSQKNFMELTVNLNSNIMLRKLHTLIMKKF
jgi:glycosyltransferase involved in cell wall biosynthesis